MDIPIGICASLSRRLFNSSKLFSEAFLMSACIIRLASSSLTVRSSVFFRFDSCMRFPSSLASIRAVMVNYFFSIVFNDDPGEFEAVLYGRLLLIIYA